MDTDTFAAPDVYLVGVQTALAAAADYYNGTGAEEITDAEYDQLVARIGATEAAHPDWADGSSAPLFASVAAGQSSGGDVVHPTPMLSLDKYTENKVGEGYPALEKFIAGVGGPVVVEPKFDGMAVRAVYRDGRLAQVVTRGDGLSGEDVTEKATDVHGLPAKAVGLPDCEVRGEIFINAAGFEQANVGRIASGKPAFKNARNTVAGALRSDSQGYVIPLSFAAYDVVPVDADVFEGSLRSDDPARGTYRRRTDVLLQFRFATARHYLADVIGSEQREPVDAVKALLSQRSSLEFPIDGAVIKADRDEDRIRLGEATRAPRWAMAFKFAAESMTTVVEAIEMTVGRTGRLALRAKVTPTTIDGIVVTYASLHNVSWLTENDIRIGDTVHVKRAGDVIPRVESPILALRPPDAAPWQAPDTDPAGNPWDKSTLLWRSTSPELSVAAKLIYAASRDALDIEGMSVALIEALVEQRGINDLADLLTLTADELATLELGTTGTGKPRLLGAKVAAKVGAQVVAARTRPLSRFITAFGIRGTGRSMSRRIATHFTSMDALLAAGIPELTQVEGIGDTKAEVIAVELVDVRSVVEKLTAAGISIPTEDSADSSESTLPLTRMNVVVTGSMKSSPALATLSRNEMNDLIESLGGKASGSVSKSTSLLVCGEPGSSKYVKAVELGIPILSPEEFATQYGIGDAGQGDSA